MAKYRKRPVVIEAEQFFPEKYPWPDGVVRGDTDKGRGTSHSCGVQTMEGFMIASPGDWIITGVKGEKYPCKPDIFERTYEKVED